MANTKKINHIVEAFERWRKNRVSRRSATPQALRQQAVDLLEHCSSSKVTAMLRISDTQLKQWREAVEPCPTSSYFIRLPVQGVREPLANDHLSVELRLCNGAALTLSGDISQAFLVAMIQEVRLCHLTAQTPILIATEPADFRVGIDGLAALCRSRLTHEPCCGILFVFINRNKTMIRTLAYDGIGFWLMTKRLSKGNRAYIN